MDRDHILTHRTLAGMRGRDFLALKDYEPAEIAAILDLAQELKREQKAGVPHPILSGRTLAMLFHKASTRTRISFEVGMLQLGGHAVVLSAADLQLGRGETLADTSAVLSRYVDGLVIRTYSHADVEELARHATIPIINGLTDLLHPCQVLADLLTIAERRNELKGVRFVYVGDGNNMAHSLMVGCVKMGMDCVICTPPGFGPNPAIVAYVEEQAALTGGSLTLCHDPLSAATEADVLYTDVWVSMGQEEEGARRLAAFEGFQINSELVAAAKADVMVMHCLPAHRGEEVTAEAIDGPHSVVFDQAENRLHAQKALLAALLV